MAEPCRHTAWCPREDAPWSPEEDARILAIQPRRRGSDLASLAAELGRSHRRVAGRRYRLQRQQREATHA